MVQYWIILELRLWWNYLYLFFFLFVSGALCEWGGWMNGAYSRLSTTHGHITDCKLLVCMCCIRLVLVRPAASLDSASPLKHHPMGKQWCPNPDYYSGSEPARRSLTLLCWALSRVAESQILTSFVWRGRGSNHQPPACQANAQPLHYPAAVPTVNGTMRIIDQYRCGVFFLSQGQYLRETKIQHGYNVNNLHNFAQPDWGGQRECLDI